jgi:hypothetical protein
LPFYGIAAGNWLTALLAEHITKAAEIPRSSPSSSLASFQLPGEAQDPETKKPGAVFAAPGNTCYFLGA